MIEMEGMREIRGFTQRWEDKHPLVILSKVHKPGNFESLNSLCEVIALILLAVILSLDQIPRYSSLMGEKLG